MMINEGRDFVICSTGKSLCMIKKSKLMNGTLMTQPVMMDYSAYSKRFKGLGFTLKRKILANTKTKLILTNFYTKSSVNIDDQSRKLNGE
ncbi:MAG: hypothetical protein QXY73_06385 [Candidatus Bathyarchaeia archaeon]